MRPRWHLTQELEREIRHVYADPPTRRRRAVGHLAEAWGIPLWRISRWAVELGAYQQVTKPLRWSEAELSIVRLSAHLGLGAIRKRLAAAGFLRTCVAIKIQMTRKSIQAEAEGYSSRQVAQCFGVDEKTVGRWISRGLLKAKRRGTLRIGAQGGDQWLIREKDVRRFILANLGEIHLGKVDKYWFVSLLTGKLGQDPHVAEAATG